MNKILKYIIYIIFGILLYICLNNIEKLDIRYRLQEGVTDNLCLSSNNMSTKCMDSIFHDSTTVIFGIMTIVLMATIFVILGSSIIIGYGKSKQRYEEQNRLRKKNR